MRKRSTLTFSIFILLLVAAMLLFQQLTRPGTGDRCAFEGRIDPEKLHYVEHAKCRMTCRDIDRDLVEDVYLKGELNCAKSDPAGTRGGQPRWALELEDGRRGRVRVIIEDDDGRHVVVTAIRLGEEDHCDCS